MVELREAVGNATSYLSAVMDGKARDIRLEEIELSADEQRWLVTLSALFPTPDFPAGPLGPGLEHLLRAAEQREYKTFTIDSGSGTVRSMKIRTLP